MRRKTILAAVLCISATSVVCGSDFEQRISEKHWLRDFYTEAVYRKDRNIVVEYQTRYKEEPSWFDYSVDDEVFWFEDLPNYSGEFDIVTFRDHSEDNTVYPIRLYLWHYGFNCNVTKLNPDLYELQIEDVRISQSKYESRLADGHDMRFARDAAEPEYSLYFQFDGEYLYIYLEDRQTLYATYCAYDEAELRVLTEAIGTNEFDLSRFTFPVHADGSCEYDKAEAETVKAEKIEGGVYRVTENLQLRETGDTSGAVITTMQAGTLVQILSTGKEETIDGIADNWAEIEIQIRAKDADGTIIPSGTIGQYGTKGWCFGGYLQ